MCVHMHVKFRLQEKCVQVGKCCWGSSETSVAADTTLRQPSHTHARMTKPAGAWHALFATRLPRHGYRVPFPHLAYMTEPSSLSHISDSCINMQSGETKCKRETARGVKGDDDTSQKVIPRDTKKCTAASVSSPAYRLVFFSFVHLQSIDALPITTPQGVKVPASRQ